MPALTVFCGGGGVGKTTIAAALGVALARTGARTLVVTADPARRLADAMGIAAGAEPREVRLPGLGDGHLWVRMPDVRTLADDFIAWLFDDESARDRVRQNLAYRELADAIVGTHELLTLTLVELDLQGGRYDHVVLDTAPSRNALEYLTAPRRLLDVLEARTLRWIAQIASRSMPQPGAKSSGIARWGRERIEGLLTRVMGSEALFSVAALLGEVVHVRRRWADVVRAAYKRLLGGGARFVLVGAPTGAAIDDLRYLRARLRELAGSPSAIVLNRADTTPPLALSAVLDELPSSPSSDPLRQALQRLRGEYEARAALANRAVALLSEDRHPVPLVRLPFVATREPFEVVRALSEPLREILPWI